MLDSATWNRTIRLGRAPTSSWANYRAGRHQQRPTNARLAGAVDTDLILGAARYMGEYHVAPGLILGAANLLFMGISLFAANPRRASKWACSRRLVLCIYYNPPNLTQLGRQRPRQKTVVALSAAGAPSCGVG